MEKRPIGREKKVAEGTGKIGRQGSGLGRGPVGNRKGNTGLGARGGENASRKSPASKGDSGDYP